MRAVAPGGSFVTAATEPGLGDDETTAHPADPPVVRRPVGRRWLVPAIIASVVQLLLCGVAAAVSYGPGVAPVGDGSTTPPSSTPPTSAPPTSPAAPPSAAATTPPASATAKASGPRVDTFKISKVPVCASTGTPGVYGGQIVLQWSVGGGATGSQLFTDGVLFDTYGTSHTVTLAFACNGLPGDTVTHTYAVKTVGGGSPATRTLTASATIPH